MAISSAVRIFVYGYSTTEGNYEFLDHAQRTYGDFAGQVAFKVSVRVVRSDVRRTATEFLASHRDQTVDDLVDYLHPYFAAIMRLDLVGIEECRVFDTEHFLGDRGPFRKREIWP